MNRTDTMATVGSVARQCHVRLEAKGLLGPMPSMRFLMKKELPGCLYMPKANALVSHVDLLATLDRSDVVSQIIDSMAMCAYYRKYQRDVAQYSQTAAKARLQAPQLPRYKEGFWRHFRTMIADVD